MIECYRKGWNQKSSPYTDPDTGKMVIHVPDDHPHTFLVASGQGYWVHSTVSGPEHSVCSPKMPDKSCHFPSVILGRLRQSHHSTFKACCKLTCWIGYTPRARREWNTSPQWCEAGADKMGWKGQIARRNLGAWVREGGRELRKRQVPQWAPKELGTPLPSLPASHLYPEPESCGMLWRNLPNPSQLGGVNLIILRRSGKGQWDDQR